MALNSIQFMWTQSFAAGSGAPKARHCTLSQERASGSEKHAEQVTINQIQRLKVNENMRNPRKTEDYEVGYAKPPESGKFKKGVSGNPSGRPKKLADLGSQLLR